MPRPPLARRRVALRDNVNAPILDGTLGSSDIGVISYSAAIHDNLETAFTFLANIYPREAWTIAGGNGRIIAHNGATANDRFFELFGSQSSDRLSVRICDNVTSQVFAHGKKVKAHHWSWVGCAYEQSNVAGVIVDGELQTTASTVDLTANNSDTFIGAYASGGGSSHPFNIAEAILFNRLLTQSEIDDFIYDGRLPSNARVVYWLDGREKDVSEWKDGSGNGHHMAFSGDYADFSANVARDGVSTARTDVSTARTDVT